MAKSQKTSEPGRRQKRRPSLRQAVFVSGILKGKSGRRAALDAGYAPSTADRARTDILPAAERAFAPAVRKAIPIEHIIQRLVEGLNAQVVKVASFEGAITDEAAYVDFAERRAYAELIVRLSGYYVPTERIETPGRDLSGEELIEKIMGQHRRSGKG